MYAVTDQAEYVEDAIETGVEVFTTQNTLLAVLPNKAIGTTGTLLGFSTTKSTATGDPILVFNDEYPDGNPDTVLEAVDAGGGVYNCTFTKTDYASVATKVSSNPAVADYPRVYTQAIKAGEYDRLGLTPITLTYVSSSDSTYVGSITSSTYNGELSVQIGDVLDITVAGVITPVVLTSVEVTGIAELEFTCGFVETDTADSEGAIRTRPDTQFEDTQLDVLVEGDQVTMTFGAKVAGPGDDWSVIQRAIKSDFDWNIVEPFTMQYTEGV